VQTTSLFLFARTSARDTLSACAGAGASSGAAADPRAVVEAEWILIGEFIGTTSLGKASALLSSIPRLYNSPRGERKKPKYMSLFFL
jgi:hypothetical protein